MKPFAPKSSPPAWVAIPPGQINQCCKSMTHIVSLMNYLDKEVALQELGILVGMNQNPGCGGDGTFSVEQWDAASKVLQGIQATRNWCQQFMNAPIGPLLRDDISVKQRQERSQLDILFDGDDLPF